MSWIIALVASGIFGLLAFPLLPIVGGAVGWRAPGRVMGWLASQPIKRLAIVVSEHNDLVPKTMRFDALGVERISLDGEDKAFGDPANRLHQWLGLPFALADEETGVLIDPRDAAMGERKRKFDERNDDSFAATDGEWQTYGITEWVPGAFTFEDAYELVDLSAASELVDGGERSEYPKRVKEMYKHSRDPFSDGTPLMRLALPVLAFAATFGGVWLLASQVGVPGGGGGGTVVQGSLALLVALLAMPGGDGGDDDDEDSDDDKLLLSDAVDEPADEEQPEEDDGPGLLARARAFCVEHSREIRHLFTVLGVLVGIVAIEAAILLTMGLFAAIVSPIAFLAGLATVPMLALTLGKLAPNSVGGAFTNLFFKLYFASFRKPVLTWTPERYEVREEDELPDTAPDPEYYSLYGTRIGFSFVPGADSFGEAGISMDSLGNRTEVNIATDGGRTDSRVPANYSLAPKLGPDQYGSFVDDSGDYAVLTSIALGWWSNSADGTNSMRELLHAKEQFGGDDPAVGDKTIMYLTAAMGFLGAGLGVAIFVL